MVQFYAFIWNYWKFVLCSINRWVWTRIELFITLTDYDCIRNFPLDICSRWLLTHEKNLYRIVFHVVHFVWNTISLGIFLLISALLDYFHAAKKPHYEWLCWSPTEATNQILWPCRLLVYCGHLKATHLWQLIVTFFASLNRNKISKNN